MSVATLPQAPAYAERVIGRRRGQEPGPTLICVAALHGNEPAGVEGLQRVFADLEGAAVLRGELVGLIGNRKALAAGKRFLEDDLNRIWTDDRLRRLRGGELPVGAEDEEMLALADEIERARVAARGPVYVLDLHTTSGPGSAFALLDDTLPNRAFALEFPVPLILGLEEELAGPLLHHLVGQGMVTTGFESGQHDDPAAIDGAEAAVWVALEAAGLIDHGSRSEVAAGRQLLAKVAAGLPHVTEVRYRHAIVPEDGFRMEPGFASFDPVAEAQHLGSDVGGAVRAPETGLILMPLYQSQGEDGFFIIRPISPGWLKISRRMRRLRLERFLHWLPGVRRHPEREETFVVNRRIARWFALEIFHLLGFRRHGLLGDELVVSRRADDTPIA
ncbi:MAG: succinylglutamate desuccinylase/aspartoacylase family protein [Acidobacteriota bacterium]